MSNIDRYVKRLAEMESTNNPRKINNLGYAGLYQMGIAALMDAGYIIHNPDSSSWINNRMKQDKYWTGKDNVRNLNDFLGNVDIQKKALLIYTNRNKQTLKNNRIINDSTPINEVYGHLAGSHLLGASGYTDNPNEVDKNKTSGKKWYGKMQTVNWDNGTPEEDINSYKLEELTPAIVEPQKTETDDIPLTPAEQAELKRLEEWNATLPIEDRI